MDVGLARIRETVDLDPGQRQIVGLRGIEHAVDEHQVAAEFARLIEYVGCKSHRVDTVERFRRPKHRPLASIDHAHIVTEPGLTALEKNQLLTEDEMLEAQDEYGEDAFSADIGASAVKTMLMDLDLEQEKEDLLEELATTKSKLKPAKIIKRLKVVESFIESGNRPEWMILEVVPVIPPELRPLVPLDGGRFATSDLNDLYRRVINRNNRLKRLLDLAGGEGGPKPPLHLGDGPGLRLLPLGEEGHRLLPPPGRGPRCGGSAGLGPPDGRGESLGAALGGPGRLRDRQGLVAEAGDGVGLPGQPRPGPGADPGLGFGGPGRLHGSGLRSGGLCRPQVLREREVLNLHGLDHRLSPSRVAPTSSAGSSVRTRRGASPPQRASSTASNMASRFESQPTTDRRGVP